MDMTGDLVDLNAASAGMPTGGGLVVSGGNDQPALAHMVDTSRVYNRVVSWIEDNEKCAADVSDSEIWQRVDAAIRAYNINKKAIDPQDAGINAASMDKEFIVRTEDLADQVDEMTALIDNQMPKNKPVCRLVAKPGITEKQAELTQNVQYSLLHEKGFQKELRKFVGRFIKYPVAGLKVCRSHETSYITERVEVPLVMRDPNTGMVLQELYTDAALLDRGFSPEDIAEGGALQSALAEDGFTFVGIADQKPDGSYENLLCTKCRETAQDYVYIKAVDPRTIAVSDITVETKYQQSIHEYHSWTLTQLKTGYFHNLAELEKHGDSTQDTNDQKPGNRTNHGKQSGKLMQPVYKVIESWLEIPWEQWLNEGAFTIEEARAFALEQGFPVTEMNYAAQKWCVFHCGGVILKMYPNYLMDKCEYPYDFDSYIYGDGTFTGQGMMERLSNVAANKTAFVNLIARTLKQNLYGSMIVPGSVGLTAGDWKALYKPGGVVQPDMRFDPSEVYFHQVPDTTPNAMRMVSFFNEEMRGKGVPAVLAGEGQADTATQEAINNRRGQTVVNEASGRMLEVIVNAIRKHLGCMVNSFTTSRYIELVGEDGATMSREWTMPKEITDNLDIVPAVFFDEGTKQRLSQLFLGLTNILAPVAGPEVVVELATIAMEQAGVPQDMIERVLKKQGDITNVHQEIEAMLQNPDLQVEVKMSDPHPVCIMYAQISLAQLQQRAMELGQPFVPPQNMMEYIAIHQSMQQQLDTMAAMQAMMQGGGPEQGPKGKPKQERNDGGPSSEEGGARQDGQAAGVGNQGPMSAAGLTGQGSIGAVPGVPAGA